MNRPYAKALRMALFCRGDAHSLMSDASVRIQLKMPYVELLLRQRRLLYLRRLAWHAPDPLKALLQNSVQTSGLYPKAILGDLEWLKEVLGDAVAWDCPASFLIVYLWRGALPANHGPS